MTITTGSEVKAAGQFSNEYTDDEILTEIDIVEAELYNKYSLPKRSSFTIDNDYTTFYISEDRVHEVKRVQVSVTTDIDPSGWLSVATGSNTWEHSSPDNYITLDSSFISQYDNKTVRVQYIPKIHNFIATDIVALNLITPTMITHGEDNIEVPQVTRLSNRINRYKKLLMPKVSLLSSTYSDFDEFSYPSISQVDFR